MSELSFQEFLFFIFCGSVLLIVAAGSLWVWEMVAERVHRRRFWRGLAERNRRWVERDWKETEGDERPWLRQ